MDVEYYLVLLRLKVNLDYTACNVKSKEIDSESVLAFRKKRIALRNEDGNFLKKCYKV